MKNLYCDSVHELERLEIVGRFDPFKVVSQVLDDAQLDLALSDGGVLHSNELACFA